MNKLTKANKRWLNKNQQKVNLLYDYGLSKDEVKIISRYIGSVSNDNRYVCSKCGDIYSVKVHKIIKMTNKFPECKYDKEIREKVEEVVEDLIITLEIEERCELYKLTGLDFLLE